MSRLGLYLNHDKVYHAEKSAGGHNMKRIWKTTTPSKKASRKDQGVSPVIATILMVAITVVL
ncbi:MAG: hypothetical protein KAJ33_01905, partial [Thermoplasmata archaeon]|nr:hypothetical protein [Thermoplasmata archaeon]